MIRDLGALLEAICELHRQIRDRVIGACESSALEEVSQIVTDEQAGDTLYHIDRVSETVLVDLFEREIAPRWPLVLIAEGIAAGQLVLAPGGDASRALIRVIVDPIDGTRGLMYQKRSGWVLTGVAPNYGEATSLRDMVLAVQTEIPLLKQHLSDMLWATTESAAQLLRTNRLSGESWPVAFHPSRATTIAHGFATISRFFPGARDELAAIDEAVIRHVLGAPQAGKAHCFEDQYICTGGQCYELMVGHDRFIADLRPLLDTWLAARGEALGICCHPYDLAAMLIAEQAGVLLTDVRGAPLNAPMRTDVDVGWVGYANGAIRAQVEPALLGELRSRGFIE